MRADVTYALVESRGERFVLARDLVETVLGKKAEVLREFPGSELRGLEYEPLFDYMPTDKRAHFVVCDDYVTTTDGTGIVHIAPAFGEADMRVGQENDLPVVNAVDTEGKFVAEVTPWAGVWVKDADPAITHELKHRGLLLGVEPYEHSYPFCWRCDTPLLYYSKATWYIRTTAIKDQLIAANDDVVWHPEHIKHGRFGEWLAGNVDWALSRDRYWGTPLPVWRCEQGHTHCLGSVEELRELAAGPVPAELELHRPYVDEVVLTCPECGGEMRRVPEVIDAWFDSGSMPFAQWHYPFENQETFAERFPADFIAEAIDQTRGWFYSLLAIATLIEGRSSYKRVLCLGHILDGEGQKMSKSKGNVVQPDDILDHQGADAFRWFMFSSQQPWSPRRFSAEMVDEVVRKFLLTLWNTYSFFTLYANIDRFDPAATESPLEERPLIDRWLVGELNTLVRDVTAGLEAYDATGTARSIQQFVDDLSNWYVRRSRRRFWKSESDADKLAAYHTLYEALVTLTKLLAPFTPFVAEELYQNLVRSVDKAAAGAPAPAATGPAGSPAAAPPPPPVPPPPAPPAPPPPRACTCAPGRRSTSRRSTPASASTWRRRGAWSSWGAPRATARRSRRGSRWPRSSWLCPRPRRRRWSASATSCSTSSTSRTCASRAPRTSSSPTSSSPTSRCSGPSSASAWARCRRRSERRTARPSWPPSARTAPPSSPCPTARSVSPRRNSSSRPARRRGIRWSPRPAASSRSRLPSTTRCARRAWRASSSTRFSSRAKLPTFVSRTPSASCSTCRSSFARRPSATAAPSWPRRSPASSRSAPSPATTSRRRGWTATRSGSVSA